MLHVPPGYLDAIQSHTIATKWFGTLKTTRGVKYDVTEAIIEEGSAKLTREICSGKDLVIGATCSAQLDLSLKLPAESRYTLFGAEIRMYSAVQLEDGTWASLPLGVFEITEPPEIKKDAFVIHAYDKMMKFNKNFDGSAQGYPFDIIEQACDACGVEFALTRSNVEALTNGQLSTWNFGEVDIYTWRDLIGFMAAYLCCNAIINTTGDLTLLPWHETWDREVPPGWRFSFTPKDYECYYTSISHYFHVAGEYDRIDLAPGGLEYELEENPFIQFNDDDVRRSCLTAIIQQLSQVSYTPFTAELPSDTSLLPGDVLRFTGNHADDTRCGAITKQVIKLHGGMTVECGGADPNLNVLTDQQKRLKSLAKTSTKDTMFYYDFSNTTELELMSGQLRRVIIFNYTTTKRTHVDFHAEIKAEVIADEQYDADSITYTEHDAGLEVTYYQGGQRVREYFPADLLREGVQLIHLLYFWWASSNIVGSFEAWFRPVNCTIRIGMGAARGYIAGPGLVGEVNWDGSVYVYQDIVWRDFSTIRKALGDAVTHAEIRPTAPEISQETPRLDIGRRILRPFRGDFGHWDTHRVAAIYDDATVEKDGVVLLGGVWVNETGVGEGSVTTQDIEGERILRVTSLHTSGTGDVSYIVSFDGGGNWFYYASGWQNWLGGFGMVASVLSAIPEAQWKAMLDPRGTVMFRAFLEGDASLSDICVYSSAATDFSSASIAGAQRDTVHTQIDGGKLQVKTVYTYTSQAGSIDLGYLRRVDIDTTQFSEVRSIRTQLHREDLP